MVRRHHPVLAVVSNCYPEPRGRFPRVTHPCATRPEGLVRLACVRHAASVRSEPESNSQVDDRSARRNKPDRPVSLGTIPAQIYKLVCLRIRTFASHRSGEPQREVTLRNGINLTDQPIPRGYWRPGRRPHVPSSKPTMSKSHASHPPVLVSPGIGVPTRRDAKRRRPKGPAPLL